MLQAGKVEVPGQQRLGQPTGIGGLGPAEADGTQGRVVELQQAFGRDLTTDGYRQLAAHGGSRCGRDLLAGDDVDEGGKAGVCVVGDFG